MMDQRASCIYRRVLHIYLQKRKELYRNKNRAVHAKNKRKKAVHAKNKKITS